MSYLAMNPIVRFCAASSRSFAARAACAALALGCVSAQVARADVVHVPGDFATIQAAVDAAADGDAVHIAAGHYHEAVDTLGKSLVILGIDGAEQTTLTAAGLNTSAITVTGSGSTVAVQGLTITGGSAIDGGGIHIADTEVIVADCIIADNQAERGGGVFIDIGELSLHSTSFINNSTVGEPSIVAGYGGAVCAMPTATVQIANCAFYNNTARIWGGAVFAGELVLTDSTFSENRVIDPPSPGRGGAVYVRLMTETRPVVVNGCVFEDNAADQGGALWLSNHFGLSLCNRATVTDCTFRNNRGARGGALRIDLIDARIQGCIFDNNHADLPGNWTSNRVGGAADARPASGGTTWFIDCQFIGNSAISGGALHIQGTNVIRCSFTDNVSTDDGAAIWADEHVVVRECEFQANTADGSGIVYLQRNTSVRNCRFADNSTSTGGVVHSGASPFTPSSWPGAANLLLCNNTWNEVTGSYDDHGGSVFQERCNPQRLLHVPGGYTSIQSAVDAAALGDAVIIAPGVYHEAVVIANKHLELRSEAGPGEVIIDAAGLDGRSLHISGGSYVTLDGLTLTGGHADDDAGGGLNVSPSGTGFTPALVMRNCTIKGNSAMFAGGAFISAAWAIITDCLIENNHADVSIGGAYLGASQAQLSGTILRDNSASEYGGALRVVGFTGGHVLVESCIFERNLAGTVGGGAYSRNVRFSNCQFRDNVAAADGGIHAWAQAPQHAVLVEDSTFCGNSPNDFGDQTIDLGGNTFQRACPDECPADLSGNGEIGTADLLTLLAAWGACPAAPGCPGDINRDGAVNTKDLVAMLDAWGVCE